MEVSLMLDEVLKAVDGGAEESISGLKEFLQIPSVSTAEEHAEDVRRCAQWLCRRLRGMGLEAQVLPTAGHPVVLARNAHEAGRPTVLMYGHYDVQPPDPLDQWRTPPFEPAVRDGAIWARGAADDKGQVWAHVRAIEAWQAHGGMPVNLVAMIEGEEEIGSEHLGAFMMEHREQLAADIAVVSDTNQFARGLPAITYGLRGLAYCEVVVRGADHDLHSGLYGGAVPNPANLIIELLAGLHDEQGRVMLDGFYDDVLPVSDAEREQWRRLPFDEEAFARELGLSRQSPCGEAGYSTIERKWARPTCDVNGLSGGFQGKGAKTIIPSAASAKLSMRLVPNQDPAKVVRSLRQWLEARAKRVLPPGVQMTFTMHSAAPPVLVPREGRAIRLASEALEIGFGAAPTLMREGGSIPVVSMIKGQLGIDALLVGFGLPDDRVHSPNEKFELDALHKGTRTAAALYARLAELRG